MAWFTADFNAFFKDLARNNNKEWFDSNRERYETSVKGPFAAFVAEIIKRVQKVDKRVRIEPKEAIFRINRDIRFSRDKTPYKTSVSAIISPGGRKDHSIPGIYFELGPEHVAIYGGRYQPDGDDVAMIRAHIAANLKKFRSLCEDRTFKKYFGSIQGEKNKVLPAEFKEIAKKEPLIANKQFYWGVELPPKTVVDPKLADILMERYKAMKPMNDLLSGPGRK